MKMWQMLIGPVASIIEKLIPDPQAQANAKLKMMEMGQAGELAFLDADVKLALGQMEINKAEAQHSSRFISGPRPFILWVCGFSLAWASLFEPIARFVAKVVFEYTGTFPIIDPMMTMPILLGLLGLGGLRTFEKYKNVENNR